MRRNVYAVLALLVTICASIFVVEPASAAVPRIGGTWTVRGEGTWGDIAVTDEGTSTITSYIDTDGYEVITEYSYSGVIRDGAENVLLRDQFILDRADLGGGIKVRNREAVIGDFRITIISETRIDAHRTGRVEGQQVDADYALTREVAPTPETAGGSGGCSAGVLSWSSVLLLLPVVMLGKKK